MLVSIGLRKFSDIRHWVLWPLGHSAEPLLPDVGFSSSHHLIQRSITAFRHLMYASAYSLKLCRKMNEGITSASQVTTPNTMMWTRSLVFINNSTSCGNKVSQWLFCEFTMPAEIFLINENSKYVQLEGMPEFKTLQWSLFFCPWEPVIKKISFF